MINKYFPTILYYSIIFALVLVVVVQFSSLFFILFDIYDSNGQFLSEHTFVIVYILFKLIVPCYCLFLLKKINNVSPSLEELNEKAKQLVNVYFFKVAYYSSLITSVFLLLANGFALYILAFHSDSLEFGAAILAFYFIFSVPLNILLFFFVTILKKFLSIELKESSRNIKIVAFFALIPLLYITSLSLRDIFSSPYIISTLPKSFMNVLNKKFLLSTSDKEFLKDCQNFLPKASFNEKAINDYIGYNLVRYNYVGAINKCIEYHMRNPVVLGVNFDEGSNTILVTVPYIEDSSFYQKEGYFYMVLENIENGTKRFGLDSSPSQVGVGADGSYVFYFHGLFCQGEETSPQLKQCRTPIDVPAGKYKLYLEKWGLESNKVEITIK